MSTGAFTTTKPKADLAAWSDHKVAWKILRAMGSLHITVWGFVLAIVILFFGTLAQDEETVVDVKREYFNSWIATVPLDVLKPVTIWPVDDFGRWPGGLIMPGGATIGLVLLINLIAAKLTRFHLTAKGGRLVAGLAFCLVGATITAVVILGAHAEDGLQGEPPFQYETLWQLCRGTIFLSTIGLSAWWLLHKFETKLASIVVLLIAVALAMWSLAILLYPNVWRIPDPGLRIVWQMSKSLIAGGILLVGLNLLFGVRGGNVLIHLSIGLLMLGQFIFGDRQIEERITLADGEKSSMALRLDEFELAFIDESSPDKNRVIAVDEDAIKRSFSRKTRITDSQLPFQIAVLDFYDNADLTSLKKESESRTNLATRGLGLEFRAVPVEKTGGAKEGTNMPAAYIELFDKDGKESLGKHLVALQVNDFAQLTRGRQENILDQIKGDQTLYSIAMRFRRHYKDYEVFLKDVERINYVGTATPRDYSSYVEIKTLDGSESLDARVWMNNPVRFRGETFYQSDFVSAEMAGKDTTGLQVVRNAGWLMPYIACAFAALGMLGHFGTTFARFASRFDREVRATSSVPNPTSLLAQSSGKDDLLTPLARSSGRGAGGEGSSAFRSGFQAAAAKARTGIGSWLLPLITVATVGGMFASYASIPKTKEGKFNWYAAGQIPMQHEGRTKPLDSVARNTLQALSGKSSTVTRAADSKKEQDTKYSATEWFYGVIAGQDWVDDAKVFRIDAKEVIDTFKLDPKDSGGTIGPREMIFGQAMRHRYSWKQLEPNLSDYFSKIEPILDRKEKQPGSLRFVDQKFLELYQKLNIYQLLKLSYSTNMPSFPKDPEDKEATQAFTRQLMDELQAVQRLESGGPPAMIPPVSTAGDSANNSRNDAWRALRPSVFSMYASKAMGLEDVPDNPALMPLLDVLDAARDGKPDEFNKSIATYKQAIAGIPAAAKVVPKANFEAWYNKFSAVNGCIAFYIMAALFAFASMLVFPQSLRRIAFWMILTTFVFHAVAIAARIYITGRAPVINLYSSAVYIGCGAVLFGLIIEYLFPIRIGLLVGSIVGATTLLVANQLETSDTMPVLQAVLDTQFWLTTHVQCITLGYCATFMAGALAIAAIVHRALFRRALSIAAGESEAHEVQRILFRITYGTICFAIFFSFIGTVLGGLWADDSWGRFWGWDPKENGALMIVLWNAVVLHARWDKLVRERGFALLCIAGNIITAWSWFGTNQLGIGLHSYGFTDGVLKALAAFFASQVLIIVLGAWLTMGTHRQAKPNEPVGSWE
jgi:ABC-type transport system involved in cytochrome c biogenesis permease subunit